MAEEYLPEELIPDPTADPAHLTRETVDLGRYYALDELVAMPADVLEELWLACPDRPFYEAALKRAFDDTFGADAVVSDIDRLAVIDECILYYTGQHPELPGSGPRIPTARRSDGSVKWFKVSDRIREHLERGLPLEEPQTQGKPGINLRVVIPAAALALTAICVLVMILRNALGGEALTEVDMTATAAVEAALPPGPGTPTPTPLALENLDRPIRAGDELRGYYPVLLEIDPADGLARVFPVQQREVEIAEWQYDPDPDVASAVLGLVVRPVLGIPYSTANASFLSTLAEGDAIQLRMSTGQTLLFVVSGSERVNRQAVSIFEQRQPGIVIVLLQEPTGDRLAVYGEYAAAQEALTGSAEPDSIQVAQGIPAEWVEGLSVTVLESSAEAGSPTASLPPDLVYLLVDLEFSASTAFDTRALAFEVIGGPGERYVPVTVDASMLNQGAYRPVVVGAGQTIRSSLAFIVPRQLSAPFLLVTAGDSAQRFALDGALPDDPDIEGLDVLVTGMEIEGTSGDPDELRIVARLFNPNPNAITLGLADVYVVYSPVVLDDAFPLGPALQEAGEALPLVVDGGEAVDVVFRFPWNGDSFVGFQVGGYRFIAALR